MNQRHKLVLKMKNHPQGWHIDELKRLADFFDIDYKQPGTSHVTFRTKTGQKLTVPAHKPIKPIYIKYFLLFIDSLQGE